MITKLLSSRSLLTQFLVFNLLAFIILGFFTFLYLKAIQPELIAKQSSKHLRIIKNIEANLNIKKGLKQELGLTKAQTGRDFKAAELKYRSGLKADFNSQYTPENTAVLYAVDRANGGLIQKFMAGSPGGVQLGKGRGKPGRRGARFEF